MSVHIRLDKVSLAVPLYVQPERRVRSWAGMLLGAAFDPPRRVYANILQDISFEAGDVLDVVLDAFRALLLRHHPNRHRAGSGDVAGREELSELVSPDAHRAEQVLSVHRLDHAGHLHERHTEDAA